MGFWSLLINGPPVQSAAKRARVLNWLQSVPVGVYDDSPTSRTGSSTEDLPADDSTSHLPVDTEAEEGIAMRKIDLSNVAYSPWQDHRQSHFKPSQQWASYNGWHAPQQPAPQQSYTYRRRLQATTWKPPVESEDDEEEEVEEENSADHDAPAVTESVEESIPSAETTESAPPLSEPIAAPVADPPPTEISEEKSTDDSPEPALTTADVTTAPSEPEVPAATPEPSADLPLVAEQISDQDTASEAPAASDAVTEPPAEPTVSETTDEPPPPPPLTPGSVVTEVLEESVSTSPTQDTATDEVDSQYVKPASTEPASEPATVEEAFQPEPESEPAPPNDLDLEHAESLPAGEEGPEIAELPPPAAIEEDIAPEELFQPASIDVEPVDLSEEPLEDVSVDETIPLPEPAAEIAATDQSVEHVMPALADSHKTQEDDLELDIQADPTEDEPPTPSHIPKSVAFDPSVVDPKGGVLSREDRISVKAKKARKQALEDAKKAKEEAKKEKERDKQKKKREKELQEEEESGRRTRVTKDSTGRLVTRVEPIVKKADEPAPAVESKKSKKEEKAEKKGKKKKRHRSYDEPEEEAEAVAPPVSLPEEAPIEPDQHDEFVDEPAVRFDPETVQSEELASEDIIPAVASEPAHADETAVAAIVDALVGEEFIEPMEFGAAAGESMADPTDEPIEENDKTESAVATPAELDNTVAGHSPLDEDTAVPPSASHQDPDTDLVEQPVEPPPDVAPEDEWAAPAKKSKKGKKKSKKSLATYALPVVVTAMVLPDIIESASADLEPSSIAEIATIEELAPPEGDGIPSDVLASEDQDLVPGISVEGELRDVPIEEITIQDAALDAADDVRETVPSPYEPDSIDSTTNDVDLISIPHEGVNLLTLPDPEGEEAVKADSAGDIIDEPSLGTETVDVASSVINEDPALTLEGEPVSLPLSTGMEAESFDALAEASGEPGASPLIEPFPVSETMIEDVPPMEEVDTAVDVIESTGGEPPSGASSDAIEEPNLSVVQEPGPDPDAVLPEELLHIEIADGDLAPELSSISAEGIEQDQEPADTIAESTESAIHDAEDPASEAGSTEDLVLDGPEEIDDPAAEELVVPEDEIIAVPNHSQMKTLSDSLDVSNDDTIPEDHIDEAPSQPDASNEAFDLPSAPEAPEVTSAKHEEQLKEKSEETISADPVEAEIEEPSETPGNDIARPADEGSKVEVDGKAVAEETLDVTEPFAADGELASMNNTTDGVHNEVLTEATEPEIATAKAVPPPAPEVPEEPQPLIDEDYAESENEISELEDIIEEDSTDPAIPEHGEPEVVSDVSPLAPEEQVESEQLEAEQSPAENEEPPAEVHTEDERAALESEQSDASAAAVLDEAAETATESEDSPAQVEAPVGTATDADVASAGEPDDGKTNDKVLAEEETDVTTSTVIVAEESVEKLADDISSPNAIQESTEAKPVLNADKEAEAADSTDPGPEAPRPATTDETLAVEEPAPAVDGAITAESENEPAVEVVKNIEEEAPIHDATPKAEQSSAPVISPSSGEGAATTQREAGPKAGVDDNADLDAAYAAREKARRRRSQRIDRPPLTTRTSSKEEKRSSSFMGGLLGGIFKSSPKVSSTDRDTKGASSEIKEKRRSKVQDRSTEIRESSRDRPDDLKRRRSTRERIPRSADDKPADEEKDKQADPVGSPVKDQRPKSSRQTSGDKSPRPREERTRATSDARDRRRRDERDRQREQRDTKEDSKVPTSPELGGDRRRRSDRPAEGKKQRTREYGRENSKDAVDALPQAKDKLDANKTTQAPSPVLREESQKTKDPESPPPAEKTLKTKLFASLFSKGSKDSKLKGDDKAASPEKKPSNIERDEREQRRRSRPEPERRRSRLDPQQAEADEERRKKRSSRQEPLPSETKVNDPPESQSNPESSRRTRTEGTRGNTDRSTPAPEQSSGRKVEKPSERTERSERPRTSRRRTEEGARSDPTGDSKPRTRRTVSDMPVLKEEVPQPDNGDKYERRRAEGKDSMRDARKEESKRTRPERTERRDSHRTSHRRTRQSTSPET